MGLEDTPVEEKAIYMARNVVIYNGDAVYYLKNSLNYLDENISRRLKEEYEKLTIRCKDMFPNIDVDTILAFPESRENHDITKLDVGIIKEFLLEVVKK